MTVTSCVEQLLVKGTALLNGVSWPRFVREYLLLWSSDCTHVSRPTGSEGPLYMLKVVIASSWVTPQTPKRHSPFICLYKNRIAGTAMTGLSAAMASGE